jgi:hypothetical protein
VGIGGGLVFDEFALLLYLSDVYWSPEGRKSLEMVTIVVIVLLCLLIGVSPVGVDEVSVREFTIRITMQIHFVICAAGAAICLFKGKYYTAAWAMFFAVVAALGAVRLARPGSIWANRFYPPGSSKARRAEKRAARFSMRWGRLGTKVGNVIAGAVSQPNPPVNEEDGPSDGRSR